jgi:hypothetical protein
MSDFVIDFEWHRDLRGYRLVPIRSLNLQVSAPAGRHLEWIVPLGTQSDWITYRPLEQFKDLYLLFSEIRTAPELLAFVNQWGPLSWSDSPIKPNFVVPDGIPAIGEPVPAGLVQAKMFRELLALKRTPRRVRFHDLRHSHATQLLSAGVHPKVAQERLGHSTITTTLDLYSHVSETIQGERRPSSTPRSGLL